MLLGCDIARLAASFNPEFAVQVVQHPDYETAPAEVRRHRHGIR